MLEKFKVDDFEQSQKQQTDEHTKEVRQTRQQKFKKIDEKLAEMESRNRDVLMELEDKFKSLRVI